MGSKMKGKYNNSQAGFTLVELMIVLMVITIIAVFSTMSALSARVRTNESHAQSSLKTISTGCEMYLNSLAIYPAFAQIMNKGKVLGPKSIGMVFQIARNRGN